MYDELYITIIKCVQELLATLSSKDQGDVDQLNDDIRRLKTENKKAFAERMRLEAQKNKLGKIIV